MSGYSNLELIPPERTTVDDWSTSYPFVFAKSGWYMLVINQTWIQTTIVGLRSQRLERLC